MSIKVSKYLLLVFFIIVFHLSNGQDKQHSFEIRTGLQGQFYFKNGYIGGYYLNQTGGSGRAATIGGGIPINYIYKLNKFSISISPVIRYSKLVDPSRYFQNYDPNDKKWGLTVDTHVSIQWKLKGGSWLSKNTSLGTGLSLFNIGQPFNTYYGWTQYPSSIYNEYQAKTLMYWGLHALYDRQFGEKFSLKFMITYSMGHWIKYTPLITYSVLGNISLQYRVFGK